MVPAILVKSIRWKGQAKRVLIARSNRPALPLWAIVSSCHKHRARAAGKVPRIPPAHIGGHRLRQRPGVFGVNEPFASARLDSSFLHSAICAAAFPNRPALSELPSALSDFAVRPGSATFEPDKRVFLQFHVGRFRAGRLAVWRIGTQVDEQREHIRQSTIAGGGPACRGRKTLV